MYIDFLIHYCCQFLVNSMKEYSPMRTDLSMKGLSEIVQESYKDQLQSSRFELAKLSNQQFLSQYLQLNYNRNIMQEYKYFLQTPTCEVYHKFNFNDLQKKQNIVKQIKQSIESGVKKNITFFSKQELKALASKKVQQANQKQKLSSSRNQKRDTFYQKLRTSRKSQEESLVIKKKESMVESPKKDAVTELSIQDIFLRLQVIGEKRDKIKKRWYGLVQKTSIEQKRKVIGQWSNNHNLMKSLLELLLESLNKSIGTVEVFNQLKISNQNVLKALTTKPTHQNQHQKSLGSTRVDKNLRNEDIKVIYRFGSWFNKLLLDQREIQYTSQLLQKQKG